MKSMTAYSQTEDMAGGKKIVVRIRSTNNRFVQVRFNLPESLYSYEHKLRALIKERISRGYLEILVSVKDLGKNAGGPQFDKEKAALLAGTLKELVQELNLPEDVDLSHLLMAKNLFMLNQDEEEAVPPDVAEKVETLFRSALLSLDEMRIKEGEHLAGDIAKRLGLLAEKTARIKEEADNSAKENYEKIKKKVLEFSDLVNLDESRLLQEVAYLTERAEITEELIRLESHIAQARDLLKETDGPVGKKFDFLFQEIFREMNTISAKTNSLLVSRIILEGKAEVEKLREQINNIE